VSQVEDAVRIGPEELVEIEGPPEIHRRQAFAKPGLWAGLTTTEPGLVSGWHHHGGHDTIVYVISRVPWRSSSARVVGRLSGPAPATSS
jgi:hypothetical protein